MLKEIETSNTYEVQIRNGDKVVAHVGCSFTNGGIYIRDLFVLRDFRGKGLEEVLLTKVLDYAATQKAKKVVSYCGAEPFCEDGQIPIEQEILWYENHGFSHHHNVMGVTPCMVKEL